MQKTFDFTYDFSSIAKRILPGVVVMGLADTGMMYLHGQGVQFAPDLHAALTTLVPVLMGNSLGMLASNVIVTSFYKDKLTSQLEVKMTPYKEEILARF